MSFLRPLPLLALLLVGPGWAAADCPCFHDSLDSLASIGEAGGNVAGSVGFTPAVNGNGILFGDDGQVTYPQAAVLSHSGSIALWYRRTGAQSSGGIVQIGTLGQPRGVGLFYLNNTDLVFELRTDAGELGQVHVPGVLSATDWTHIVATWRQHDGACDLWVFIDGRYRAYSYRPGTFAGTALPIQIGVTGYYGHGQGGVDELRVFAWNLSDSEVYAEFLTSANRQRRQPSVKPVSTGPVQLIDGKLVVAGEPFTVKGVGYAPTPIGQWPGQEPFYSDPAIIARDVPLLRAMPVNTIRTWSQLPDTALLDALYNGGEQPIYVIMGFWVPLGLDYASPAVIASVESQFRALVRQFKDHPALLAWGLGNEVNLHASGANLRAWYALAERLAQAAYEEEGAAYHPTILVNAGLWDLGDVQAGSDDVSLPHVDCWGLNVYFGDDPHCLFDYYERLSAKPLVLTEYGIDAWDNVAGAEYPDVQAAWNVRQWRQLRRRCLGASLMAYSDEWWKADNPWQHDMGGYGTTNHPDGFSNEEWWGLFSAQVDGGGGPDVLTPRAAYAALGQEYAHDPGDADGDGDIDLRDVGMFQRCLGASTETLCGTLFEYVVDGVLDGADFAAFAADVNGPAEHRRLAGP